MPRLVFCFAIVVVIFLSSAGPATTQPHQPIRAFDQATIEALGVAIYQQDRRAAVATDALLARTDETSRQTIRGWIFRSERPDATIRFVRERGGLIEAAFDIDDRDGAWAVTVPIDRALSAFEMAQFKARGLASRNLGRPCSEGYNTVILREPGSDRWLVWLLAATTKPNLVFVGGHVRFTISSDGETIVSRDPLSMTCFALDRNQVPAGARAEAMYMTHLVSDTPVETHVFVSLLHRLTLLIGTPDRMMWEVKEGHMRKLGPLKEAPVQKESGGPPAGPPER